MEIDGADVLARGITALGPEGVVFEYVDVRVEPGELGVVVGSGQTGRTSLLFALGGRLRTISGHLEVSGFVLPPEARAVRRLIAPARLRPGFELEPKQRVREAIAERRMLSRVSNQDIHDAFALVGIDPDPDCPVTLLHPADQLLLAVSLAVAARPAGILVDDVDLGLPLPARSRAWSALRAITETGMTVLASSVDPPFGGGAVLIRLPYGQPDFDEANDDFPLFDRTKPITEDQR
ncbi:P-loop NTPase family protein [Parasphingorhabdus pacifica]